MKHKLAYRIADLKPGDRFYTDSNPFEAQIVGTPSIEGNVWTGNRKRYLHHNTRVDPVNKRAAGINKRCRLLKACKAHAVNPNEVILAYRETVAKQSRDGNNAKLVNALPEGIYNCLCDLGLVMEYSSTADNGLVCIAGSYPSRLYY